MLSNPTQSEMVGAVTHVECDAEASSLALPSQVEMRDPVVDQAKPLEQPVPVEMWETGENWCMLPERDDRPYCIEIDEPFEKRLRATCFQEGDHAVEERGSTVVRDSASTKIEDLRPIYAFCCCMSSLYCTFPDCIGWSGKGAFCCLQFDCKACKMLDSCKCVDEDRACCLLCGGTQKLVVPATLCRGEGQEFCLEMRCAFPCVKQVPMLVTLLGLTCYPKCTCCARLGDIIPALDEAAGKDPDPNAV